jgi:hypothetical protein
MDLLCIVGTAISGRFGVDFGGLTSQPRLYVLKVAKSAWRRKSTSTKFAKGFVKGAMGLAEREVGREKKKGESKKNKKIAHLEASSLRILDGAGSAEGLTSRMCLYVDEEGEPCSRDHEEAVFVGDHRIVLVFDEFRRFEKKVRGEHAVLGICVNELFESNEYANVTKTSTMDIDYAHLGFLSNTTEESYSDLLNASEMVDLGFTNRLFIVVSDERKRKAIPVAPDPARVRALEEKLGDLFAELPPLDEEGYCWSQRLIPIEPEAREIYEAWYNSLPETQETARLDAIGMRLLGVLAFLAEKDSVDRELMQAVLDMLQYQAEVRAIFVPNQGQNAQAKLENRILKQLAKRGDLAQRELYNFSNANRQGSTVFRSAISGLKGQNYIREYKRDDTTYFGLSESGTPLTN